MNLTDPQWRTLGILGRPDLRGGRTRPAHFARLMWPNSPSWKKRTYRHDGKAGQVGGTMPMMGARMLWTLQRLGLAWQDSAYDWRITDSGMKLLTDQQAKD